MLDWLDGSARWQKGVLATPPPDIATLRPSGGKIPLFEVPLRQLARSRTMREIGCGVSGGVVSRILIIRCSSRGHLRRVAQRSSFCGAEVLLRVGGPMPQIKLASRGDLLWRDGIWKN